MAFNATAIAVVIGAARQALQRENPILGAFAIDTNIGVVTAGQPVKARFRTAPSASERFDRTTADYEHGEDPNMDEASGTMLEPIKNTKRLLPLHLANGEELRGLIEAQIQRLLLDIFLDACAKITATAFPTVAHSGAAATLTSDIMRNLSNITAAQAGWSKASRQAVLESTFYGALANDDDLRAYMPSMAEAMVTIGEIQQSISGWKVHNAPSLPTNSEKLAGFITDGTGLVMASGIDMTAPGVDEQLFMNEIVRIPGAPIIQIVGHASAKGNAAWVTAKSMTTVFKGRTDGLQRIVTP